jgi:hypothetical protein
MLFFSRRCGGETPTCCRPTHQRHTHTFRVEGLQRERGFGLFFNGEPGHQTTCTLGKKTDDFVLAVFVILKYTVNHTCFQHALVYRFEILL